MGGTISVESEVDRGSTFSFTIAIDSHLVHENMNCSSHLRTHSDSDISE